MSVLRSSVNAGRDQQRANGRHKRRHPNAGNGTECGTADTESSSRRFTAPHVQKELTRLHDCTRLRALEATLRIQNNWDQLDRLSDLRHSEVSHSWLWHLDSRSGAVMCEADYILNVQKRLDARVYEGEATCRLCGALLDPQLGHSEVCATAEATRGHYAC
eukprot:389209-Karenia_brevis.AAC.1